MSMKWFCDLCTKEIKAPNVPVNIHIYRSIKNREEEVIGFGEHSGHGSYHEDCADIIEATIINAFKELVVIHKGETDAKNEACTR